MEERSDDLRIIKKTKKEFVENKWIDLFDLHRSCIYRKFIWHENNASRAYYIIATINPGRCLLQADIHEIISLIY